MGGFSLRFMGGFSLRFMGGQGCPPHNNLIDIMLMINIFYGKIKYSYTPVMMTKTPEIIPAQNPETLVVKRLPKK